MHRDGDGAGLLKLWHDAVIRASILLLPLFALFMAVSDKVFLLLFTDEYADGVWLFRIYLFLVPMFAVMQANVLAALGRTKFIFGVSVCRTVLTIGATIASIHLIGFYGPPIVIVVIGFWARAAAVWRIKRELGVDWAGIWPVRRWLAVLSVALISGAAAWGASRVLPGRLAGSLLGAAAMTVLYISLLFAFGLIDEKDRELIRHNWKRIRGLFRRK
jgi:O-antigen/teichoic acid export membrane protein